MSDSWFPEYRSANDNPLLLMPPAGTPRMDGSTNCFHLCREGLNAQMYILFPSMVPFCANERTSCQRGLEGLDALQSYPVHIFSCASNAQFTSQMCLALYGRKRLFQESKTRLCLPWFLGVLLDAILFSDQFKKLSWMTMSSDSLTSPDDAFFGKCCYLVIVCMNIHGTALGLQSIQTMNAKTKGRS